MLTFGSIAQRYRPEWLVWENVPGVLSSNGGRDFGSFLGMLGQLGYGFAYRVLDAQYFGVAQRRRRVFVVGHLGDWHRAAAVLFERHSLSGNPAPSRQARKGTAPGAASGTGTGGWPAEVSPTLNACFGSKQGQENQHINGGAGLFVPVAFDAFNQADTGDLSKTVAARSDQDTASLVSGCWWDGEDVAPTLTKQNASGAQRMPDKANFGAVLQPVAFKVRGGCEGGGKGYLGSEEAAFTLATTQDQWLAQPVAGTLGNRGLRSHTELDGHGAYIPVMQPITFGAQMSVPQTDVDMVQTLQAKNPMAVAIQGTVIGRSEHAGPQGSGADASGAMFTLTKTDVHAVAIQDVRAVEKEQNGKGWNDDGSAYTVDTHATQGVAVAQPVPYDFFQITAPVNRQNRKPGDPCHTLARDNAAHATIVQPYIGGVDYENNAHGMDEATGPLLKGSPTGGGRPLPAIATAMQVRRLTPVECERLQGFPRGYTNIPWRNKPESPDGPRYKALGNSMAVPVMRWIGERINEVSKL
jgi:DNA (cytosine-5)-methyltransferase 1